MTTLRTLEGLLRQAWHEWSTLGLETLKFWHRDEARLALVALIALVLILVVIRTFAVRHVARGAGLPALMRSLAPGSAAWPRHAPVLLFAAGIPFLIVALADPYSALVSEEATFPGRRISIMIDASTSMSTTFKTDALKTRSQNGPAFYTTVAAAEQFVRMRVKGKHHDLIALVEFGNQAYVITPFTTDYDNILLSINLISDPVEFSLFPDRGTIIAHAIEQSIGLFKAFDFLETSGNLMVIFTDGEDTRAEFEGVSLEEILQSAVDHHIPLYFVRTNYNKKAGDIIPDSLWKSAVEKTGGRFYAASDESTLLAAIRDIDRLAVGSLRVRHYTTQKPQFVPFALIAVALWLAAAAMKLSLARFQTLP